MAHDLTVMFIIAMVATVVVSACMIVTMFVSSRENRHPPTVVSLAIGFGLLLQVFLWAAVIWYSISTLQGPHPAVPLVPIFKG